LQAEIARFVFQARSLFTIITLLFHLASLRIATKAAQLERGEKITAATD
jgi:hypothetical protein